MKRHEVDIKQDLERLFSGFRWNIKGFVDDEGNLYPVPQIPQLITGIFQEITKGRIKGFARQAYQCEIMQGGAREYPELALYGGRLGTRKVAIDIKTARRKSRSRITGFTLGSFGGYFLNPDRKMPGCILPYGEFTEHWVVGFIYDWNPGAPSLSLVSNIEVIVQEKWRIASRSTGTGTTTAIGSIKDVDRLREGKGEFSSETEFEKFWRSRGRRLRRR